MATQYVDNIAKPESHPFGIATPTVVRTISLSDLSEARRALCELSTQAVV